jgi:hypothetical protein
MRMMKRVIVMTGMLCCSFILHAQSFHGGLLAGFTATQVDGDSYGGYNKAGFQGGVYVNRTFGDLFLVQMEIKYAGKGARKPVTSDDPAVHNLTLHYIELPVLGALKVKQLGSVEFGVIPAYLFSVQGEDSGGALPDDYLTSFNKFDISTLIGLNIKVFEKVFLNLRYSYSIVSIHSGDLENGSYSWFGRLWGHSTGQFNNCLSAALYFRIR